MKKIIALCLGLVMVLTGCGTSAREFTSEEFIGEYMQAEYDKFNSFASENGLGDTKIYVDGTITEVEIFPSDDENGWLAGILETKKGDKWLVGFFKNTTIDFQLVEGLKGNPIRVFGQYLGKSKTAELPAIQMERLSVVSTGMAYTSYSFEGMLSYVYDSFIERHEQDLDSQIASKNKELDKLEKELAALKGEIVKAQGKPIKLPSGYFYGGKDVPAGRYQVSKGKSNFFVSRNGRTFVNIILGGGSFGVDSYVFDLQSGDEIQTNSSVVLTPIQ